MDLGRKVSTRIRLYDPVPSLHLVHIDPSVL